MAACRWDSDTVAMETKAFPDLPQVIAGRFPRYPPLYYEMRLRRVTAQLKENPDDLPAYDDAAVACDHLGHSDEAITWMARKRARLEATARPPSDEHWYRYHANLGTILAHRWLKNGADRKRLGEMTEARDHIARAIAINPDAHFGREKYQLLVMEWILKPEKMPLGMFLTSGKSSLRQGDYVAAIKGLSGLVVLGNAWESVDIFAAMGHLLERSGESSLSHLASLRSRELIASGRRSLSPDAPREAAALIKELRFVSLNPLTGDNERHNKAVYAALRDNADVWQRHRIDYLRERLVAGRHPDTDTAFWKDLHDVPPTRLEYPWPQEWMKGFGIYGSLVVTLAGLFIAVSVLWVGSSHAARAVRRWRQARMSRDNLST
ncbi:MAG: hypothetical protein V4671_20250 [Armatimonadota bacterium]